jgi:ribosomal protein L11 methylase PrmA
MGRRPVGAGDARDQAASSSAGLIPPGAPAGTRAAPGSFRDPQGQVLESGSRIFRALNSPLAPFPHTWSSEGPLAEFIAAGKLWPAQPLRPDEVPPDVRAAAPAAVGFLEHPRIATITFPYEWPFELLKRAALLHLEFHRALLKRDLTLSDGFAYNVQFVGTRPVFIDALAIEPYVEGQPWAGYSQFCESFLNPLLLASRGCDTWQDNYRGRIRGIPTREVSRQLGFWGAWRAGAVIHVFLNSKSEARGAGPAPANTPKVSRAGLDLMLASLERCIRKLSLPAAKSVNWGGYEGDNSYSEGQRAKKHEVVKEFIARTRPGLVLDVGCNAGEYSEVALAAGAGAAIGLERDAPAVNRAVQRADGLTQPFLPLQGDIQNPSPALGWDLGERRSLKERLKPDALLCLALIHHLVLSESVPLDRVVRSLVSLAPTGIIEFVPRDDPMSRKIAGGPERLTHRYDLPTFLSILSQTALVTNQILLSDNGRVLVEYRER